MPELSTVHPHLCPQGTGQIAGFSLTLLIGLPKFARDPRGSHATMRKGKAHGARRDPGGLVISW